MSLDADSRLRTQISRNHRRGLAVVITFVILGIAIGAFAGLIWRGTHGAEIGAAIAFALLAGAAGYVLTDGERLILQSSGARPADPASYPELFEIRDDLALRAGMARPSLYVIDDPSPNAFASGLRIKHASIAVT